MSLGRENRSYQHSVIVVIKTLLTDIQKILYLHTNIKLQTIFSENYVFFCHLQMPLGFLIMEDIVTS